MTTSSNANAPRLGASGKFKAVCAVLAALAVAGIAAWVYQLMGGLGVTGMNNGTSWGLYIAMFMFFVGLSAGGLIVASSASVFHVAQYKKVALPAVVLSTVCICCAGMFILIDLGGVQRVWQHAPVSQLRIAAHVGHVRDYAVPGRRHRVPALHDLEEAGCGRRGWPFVSRFALPIAILVHSVTAWIFGLEMAKEGWYSAIMAPLFVVSAMDSGLALLLLSLLGLDKAGWFKTDHKLIASLAGLLADLRGHRCLPGGLRGPHHGVSGRFGSGDARHHGNRCNRPVLLVRKWSSGCSCRSAFSCSPRTESAWVWWPWRACAWWRGCCASAFGCC